MHELGDADMATLADELLNDFDDSGSDQDEERNGFDNGDDGHATNGLRHDRDSETPGLELDNDEEAMADAEEEEEARQAGD